MNNFWITEVSAANKKYKDSCERGDPLKTRMMYLSILNNVIINMKLNIEREGTTFGYIPYEGK